MVSALYTVHTRQEELGTDHLREELQQTRPLSVLMSEEIADLRNWAAERTVPA